MPIEIEAKMRLADVAAVEARLQALGAQRLPTLLETNTYFDTPQATLKTSDQGLRIRVEREEDGQRTSATITHKGPRAHGKLKSRTETEVVVSDPERAAELLAALGYTPVFCFEKRRVPWELDGCHVALDRLPLLGDFLEIEGPSDEVVLAVREKLHLAAAPLIHASYISILTDHLAEHRRRDRHLKLENPR